MSESNSGNYVRKNEANAKEKNRKKIIVIVVVAIVVIAAIIFAFFWTKGYRTIKLLEIFNKVSFDRDDQKNVDVYENMSLKAGDTLRTGDEESFARLVLDDDKYIFIEENSEVAFEMAGRKSSSKTTLHLNYGAIFNELEGKLNENQSFEVKSPNSLMAVRGTKFRVSTYVGPDGILYTRISVLEGNVECWLIYPDGTVSSESHIASPGSEVLIYFDEESGITDFARINEAGRYNSKETGEYIRSISYAQMPKQILKFLEKRSSELGGQFDTISESELKEYVDLDEALRDEPILERYGVPERQLVDEGYLNHVRGDEQEGIEEKYAREYLKSNESKDAANEASEIEAENEEKNLAEAENDNNDENTGNGEGEDNDTEGNSENGNGENGNSSNTTNTSNSNSPTPTPTSTPTTDQLIEQFYKEILAHPDVYASFLPTPTPESIVVASSNDEPSGDEPSSDSGSSGNDDGGSGSSGSGSGSGTPPGGSGTDPYNPTGSNSVDTMTAQFGSPDYSDAATGDAAWLGFTRNGDNKYTQNTGESMNRNDQVAISRATPSDALGGIALTPEYDWSQGIVTGYKDAAGNEYRITYPSEPGQTPTITNSGSIYRFDGSTWAE